MFLTGIAKSDPSKSPVSQWVEMSWLLFRESPFNFTSFLALFKKKLINPLFAQSINFLTPFCPVFHLVESPVLGISSKLKVGPSFKHHVILDHVLPD